VLVAIVVACGMTADAQAQTSGYAGAVLGTSGLQSYWRLGEPSGTTAVDATGNAPGSYAGGPALGARGALPLDPDTAVRFDGVDDELLAPGGAAVYATCSLEPEENQQVVEAVRQAFPQLRLDGEEERLPGRPGDGGYWARLRRVVE